MATTKIPYCDCTWDLTIGCKKRSPGCEYCWAIRTVHRLACRSVRGYEGQTEGGDNIARDWLRTPNVNLLEWNLDRPLHWRQPRFIFVNSKSDLFDQRVPFEFIGLAFDTMARARQHKYMVLTKEPGRMAEFIDWNARRNARAGLRNMWPLQHVILMTSIEDAAHLDRWAQLREIPAAQYGISFEPLIGPVADHLPPLFAAGPKPDWVVVGCEKLLGGRVGRWNHWVPTPESWWVEAGAILRHCRDGGITAWMKQGPILAQWRRSGRVTDRLEEFLEPFRVQQRPPWAGRD